MPPHEVQLQLDQVCASDTYVRQFAKAGVDAIDSASLVDDVLDHLPRLFDSRACIVSKSDLFPAPCNVYDLLESELLTIELKHRVTNEPQLAARVFRRYRSF